MIKLKEQKSIFTGLSMNVNSDGFSKSTKVDLQTISQISTRVFSIINNCLLFTTSCAPESPTFSEDNARMRILFLCRRFPRVRLGYVTEGREGLGKRRKGTRQDNLYKSSCARGAHAAEHHG